LFSHVNGPVALICTGVPQAQEVVYRIRLS
jgi:hypothetical protein